MEISQSLVKRKNKKSPCKSDLDSKTTQEYEGGDIQSLQNVDSNSENDDE